MMWNELLDDINKPATLTVQDIIDEIWRENVIDEAPSFDIVEIPKPVIQPTVDTNTVRQVQDTVRRKFMNGSIEFDARSGEDVFRLDNGCCLPIRGHRMTAAEQALMEWKIDKPLTTDIANIDRYTFEKPNLNLIYDDCGVRVRDESGEYRSTEDIFRDLSDAYDKIDAYDKWRIAGDFAEIPHERIVSAQDIAEILGRVNVDARTSIQFQNGQAMLVVNRDETGAFDALANALSYGGTLADFIEDKPEDTNAPDPIFDELIVVDDEEAYK